MNMSNAIPGFAPVAPAVPRGMVRFHLRSRLDAGQRDTAIGVGAALVAVAVWGGALSVTRSGVTGSATFGAHDIVVLRFLAPSLVLLPVLLRAGTLPLRRAGVAAILALLVGGGAPFVLLVAAGLRLAPAAEAGALLPSAMPLFVALLSAVLLGERLGRLRLAGLGLVAMAVGLIAGPAMLAVGDSGFGGHVLLLLAALVAAGYTIAMRKAGLSAPHAAALVSGASVLTFGPIYLVALDPGILRASAAELAAQVACQGLLAGLVAPIAFATAIARLGATRAAAFGGLTPVVAAATGVLLLGETPDAVTVVAVAVASLGVVLASRRD